MPSIPNRNANCSAPGRFVPDAGNENTSNINAVPLVPLVPLCGPSCAKRNEPTHFSTLQSPHLSFYLFLLLKRNKRNIRKKCLRHSVSACSAYWNRADQSGTFPRAHRRNPNDSRLLHPEGMARLASAHRNRRRYARRDTDAGIAGELRKTLKSIFTPAEFDAVVKRAGKLREGSPHDAKSATTTALTPLATVGDFVLYERRDRSTAEWRSLKIDPHGRRRREAQAELVFGWNGERLARNADTAHLAKHHPEVAAWVIARLPRRYMR